MDNSLLELIKDSFFLTHEGKIIPKEISEHLYVNYLERLLCEENNLKNMVDNYAQKILEEIHNGKNE